MTPGTNQPDDINNPAESPDDDAALDQEFEAYLNKQMPTPGAESTSSEYFDVTIVHVGETHVGIDMGGKHEVTIPLDEFPKIGDRHDAAVGQTIRVLKIGSSSDGTPRVSYRAARERAAQANIAQAFEKKVPITGRVSAVVKGGVMVDVGLAAFMPASQIDLFKIPDLNSLMGQDIEAYVIEYDPKRRRAVLSRRQLLFERRENSRKNVLGRLEVGKTVIGKVKSSLEFGVFVDLGGIDGFIPREEVSFDRGTSPAQIIKNGSEIEVIVTNVDLDSGKVTLSRKRSLHDPWQDISSRYSVGSVVTGTVASIQPYGAFVHLEEGVTGMIHAGDLSWAAGQKKPSDFLKEGEKIEAKILEIDADHRRISLGIKQLQHDPWAGVEERFPVNSRVKGTITSLTNYGAFVKIDEYIEGMIHVSDITWERRLNHPKDVLKNGQEVEALVLKADGPARRLSLGIKQLQDSPYDAFQKANPAGTVVEGKVTRFAPFGAFVQLAEGLEGLIHISQIDEHRVELPEKVLKIGDTIQVKIVKYEGKSQKISLSRKEAIRQKERDQVKAYMKKGKEEAKSFNTFADALREAREERKSSNQ